MRRPVQLEKIDTLVFSFDTEGGTKDISLKNIRIKLN